MEKRTGISLAVLLVAQSFALLACNVNSKKVLMIPREGSASLELALTKEAGVMMKMIQDNGYRVVVATASGKQLTTKKANLKPDLKLSEANPSDYVGVIMPCMNAGQYSVAEEAVTFIKKAASLNLPIAAQRGSVLVLNKAGLRDYENDPQFKGDYEAEFGGTGVFQNGNIITSGVCPYYAMETGKPDGTMKLAATFLEYLRSRTK